MIRFSALTAMVIGVIAWPAPGSNPTLGANAADWTSRPEWQYCAGAAVSNSGQIFCECGFSSQLQLQCVVEDEESRKSHVNAIFNLHFGDANDEILGISPGDAVYHDVDQANRENVVSFQVGDFHLDDWVIMNFNQHDQTVYFEYPVALDHPLLDALASGAMLEVRTHASSADIQLKGSSRAIKALRDYCTGKTCPLCIPHELEVTKQKWAGSSYTRWCDRPPCKQERGSLAFCRSGS